MTARAFVSALTRLDAFAYTPFPEQTRQEVERLYAEHVAAEVAEERKAHRQSVAALLRQLEARSSRG